MEDPAWNYGLLTSSSSSSLKYNHSANRPSWYDMYNDYEEVDVDDDLEADYPCPFCSEDFDIVGLCSHIEEVHPVEASKGFCPMCGVIVGMDLVDHVAMEHENIYRSETRGSNGGRESNYAIFILRKELADRNLKSLLETPSLVSSSNAAADMMLTSFIGNYTTPADVQSTTPSSPEDICQEQKLINESILERAMENLSVNDENKVEKARRCEFVQSLLFSTMLGDGL